MRDLKFVHSFSTRPLLIDCYGIDGMVRMLSQVWYFSLSVAYLKKLGAKIVLHTDSLGKALLGHLPYDEIRTTLDDWPDGINPRFWAAGKFVALLNESAPCIHIDGDVFIKRESLLELIADKLDRADLLVQSSDPACMYKMEEPLFAKAAQFCSEHGIVADGQDSLNTGLLGFRDDATRLRLCENYIEVARHFSANFAEDLDSGQMLTPDLLAEQKMVAGFSDMMGWRVDKLLDNCHQAATIGYQHVFTVDKINNMPSCMATLKAVDPEIYEATARLCGGELPWRAWLTAPDEEPTDTPTPSRPDNITFTSDYNDFQLCHT